MTLPISCRGCWVYLACLDFLPLEWPGGARGQGLIGVNKCCDINGNKTFYQDIFCYNRFVCSKYAKGYNQAKTLFVEKDYTFMKFVIKYQQDFTHNSRFDTSIHHKDNTGFPLGCFTKTLFQKKK